VSATYLALASFAQTWGLVYFVMLFVIVLVYALWPARQQQFDEAARMPLRED
jgi:cytochrome c oxidase cbb3-type subunit 4